jgi:hypothetical protein
MDEGYSKNKKNPETGSEIETLQRTLRVFAVDFCRNTELLMRRMPVILSVALLAVLLLSCGMSEKKRMKQEFETFLEHYEETMIPLNRETALAWFNATISGSEEDYAKVAEYELKLAKILADTESFALLRKYRDSGAITDPLFQRQLDVLYHDFLEKQINEEALEEIIRLQNENERRLCDVSGPCRRTHPDR